MLQGEHFAILWPSLSYHLSLRSFFCLLLSGRFTQVLLYIESVNMNECFFVLDPMLIE